MFQDNQDLAALLQPHDSVIDFNKSHTDSLVEQYDRELASLSKDLGVDLGLPEPSEPPKQRSPSPPPVAKEAPEEHYFEPPRPRHRPQTPYYQMSDDGDDGIAAECAEDEKLFLLEKIRVLTRTLEKTDSDDLSDLPIISKDHSLKEVQEVHKLLVQKTDRIRYTEFGQSLLIGGARLLGTIFDGNNEFFGRKIDLRGLDTRIEWKLKFIKPEITDAVRSMCSGWHPAVRTGLELATMIVMHSHDTATTMKKDNLYNDFDKASREMYKA